MTSKLLGRLTRIELRDIWKSEASDFTPWLAQPENLEVLGDTLGLELELEAQERAVGPFRADILCKAVDTGHWVLIENQLERTDHTHLGQLLTYAAGLQAVTIVWVAARFTEEHRATLDWLNKITDDSFQFFGLEVELWRIGDSPAAPKFNIISKPNDWSKSVSEAARIIEETDPSETRLMQRDYWAALNKVLDDAKGPITGHKKPQLQSWMSFGSGRSGVNIGAVMNTQKEWIRAEVYLSGAKAKGYFHQLQDQKAEIEQELAYSLEWDERPGKLDSRISVYQRGTDPTDQKDWQKQHIWLAQHVNELHRVFSPKVRELNVDESPDE
jgi:hypothetical protein